MADVKAKAWLYSSTTGGVIKNLSLSDYALPKDREDDHVLLEILSVSINPGDMKFPLLPIVSHFITKPASVCFDFCGRIRSLPRNPTKDSRNLTVGQVVWGMHRDRHTLGTLRTLMWIHQDAVYPVPANVPVEHAAALGVGALTAYQSIAPHAKPSAKLLVNGATGGVGTFSIQVGKALGMYVIAVCSPEGAQLSKDLGADEVLNYKSPTFHDDLRRTQVDVVVDNVGNDPNFHRLSEGFLKPDGQFVLVALMDHSFAGWKSMAVSFLLPAVLGGPRRRWRHLLTNSTLADYKPVADLASQGKLKVVVDSVFPFEDTPKALERLKSGRAKGKVLVNVESCHS